MSDGMGGHQSHAMGKDEWLTPPFVLAALGAFDLDPCSPIKRPWDTAAQHYTVLDDGLSKPWHGRVWCNPPYGAQAADWLARLAAHGNGIALVFARTETAAWVEHVWAKASAIRFIAGRLHFHHVSGIRAPANSGAPSALIAYGQDNAESLRACSIPGAFVPLSTAGVASPVQTQPTPEFWSLLQEWADSMDEERRDWIEHRFCELFALAAAGVQEVCRFPDCKCPMDPGPAFDWCARGLPHAHTRSTTGVDTSAGQQEKNHG